MLIKIYGRDGCSYCKKALELAKQLRMKNLAGYEYVDIRAVGISAAGLSDIVGKPVETVPQILIDGKPIGGYTELAALVETL